MKCEAMVPARLNFHRLRQCNNPACMEVDGKKVCATHGRPRPKRGRSEDAKRVLFLTRFLKSKSA